jgi:hypothetical protein
LPKLKLPSGAKRDRPVAVGAVDRDADIRRGDQRVADDADHAAVVGVVDDDADERALVEFDPAA